MKKKHNIKYSRYNVGDRVVSKTNRYGLFYGQIYIVMKKEKIKKYGQFCIQVSPDGNLKNLIAAPTKYFKLAK